MNVYKVTLENNIEYTVIDKLVFNSKEYLLLVNIDDVKDFCIRIHTKSYDIDYLERLDSKYEFNNVFNMFKEKNKDLFE